MKELITYLLTTLLSLGIISAPSVDQLPILEKISTHLSSEAQPNQNSALFNFPILTPTISPASTNSDSSPDTVRINAYNQSSGNIMPAQVPEKAVDNSPSLTGCSQVPALCNPTATPTQAPSITPTPTLVPSLSPTPAPPILLPSVPPSPCPPFPLDQVHPDNHTGMVMPCPL